MSSGAGCGPPNNNALCPASAPCCSEYYYCGTTALHCAISCQNQFSFNSKPESSASCYADRPQAKPKCVSGLYNFDANTWVINTDSYNGNYQTADWLADTEGLVNGNIKFGELGGVRLSITQNSKNKNDQGLGSRLSSTSYVLYGSFGARVLSSGIPGVVTAFISYSDVRDEIDWEITGQDNTKVQTNVFYRGVVDYTKSQGFPAGYDTSKQFSDLKVDWSENAISWSVDGRVVRVLNKADTCDSNGVCEYPSTPSRIQLAIWDGGYAGEGTRNWAGGYIPWDSSPKDVGFSIIFQSAFIQCAGDPMPTGPPPRPPGYSAPSLQEPTIPVVIPGVSGFDPNAMIRNQSVYAPVPANVVVNIVPSGDSGVGAEGLLGLSPYTAIIGVLLYLLIMGGIHY